MAPRDLLQKDRPALLGPLLLARRRRPAGERDGPGRSLGLARPSLRRRCHENRGEHDDRQEHSKERASALQRNPPPSRSRLQAGSRRRPWVVSSRTPIGNAGPPLPTQTLGAVEG